MKTQAISASAESKSPAHEKVYRQLRNDVMFGEIRPGEALTLRGIAARFQTSMTPAREALRRLSSEGALRMTSTGRYTGNALTPDRIEELSTLRGLLEPELASRAMPRVHNALIDRLYDINHRTEQLIAHGEKGAYIKGNLEFHRALYLRAQSPAMLALVETIWLQLGPTMRELYETRNRTPNTEMHRRIIGALKAGDEPGLRLAIRTDVTNGLRMLVI